MNRSAHRLVRVAWKRRLLLHIAGTAGAAAGAVLAAVNGMPELTVLLVVVGIGATWALLGEAVRPVSALANAVEAARHGGSMPDVPGPSSGVARSLSLLLQDTLGAADRNRQARDARLSALEALVRHSDVALLVYEADGRVVDMNRSAQHLLGVGRLGFISDLAQELGPLRAALENLRPGERRIAEGVENGSRYEIAVRGAAYVIAGRPITAAALVDVRPNLEDREAEAWSQLTRVLTHEIANSAGPVASLADTAVRRLARGDQQGATEALQTISRRADSLIQFVEGYRAVARVPTPSLASVALGPLAEDVARLLFASHKIELRHVVEIEPRDLVAHVDATLVEQALINLVRNAIQAVEGQPTAQIDIRAAVDDLGRPTFAVTDNGPGIPPEALGRLFVPFYTTREGGSGIGLSLCRQIARVHGGRIDVSSRPGQTTFTLVL